MIKRLKQQYEKVAFSAETGYLLNHITLNISDKEVSKIVYEENNQHRFQLLH